MEHSGRLCPFRTATSVLPPLPPALPARWVRNNLCYDKLSLCSQPRLGGRQWRHSGRFVSNCANYCRRRLATCSTGFALNNNLATKPRFVGPSLSRPFPNCAAKCAAAAATCATCSTGFALYNNPSATTNSSSSLIPAGWSPGPTRQWRHSGRLCRFELRQVCRRRCHLRYLLNWVRSLQQPLLRRNSAFADPQPELESRPTPMETLWSLVPFRTCDKYCRRCHLRYLLNPFCSLQQPLLRRNSAWQWQLSRSRVGSPDQRQWRHSGRLCRFELRQVCCRRCYPALPAQLGSVYNNLCYDETQPSLIPAGVGVQTNANGDTLVACAVSNCDKCAAAAATCATCSTGSALYNNLCYDETQPSLIPAGVGVQTNANGDTLVACAVSNCDKCAAAAATCATCSTGFCSLQQPLLR